MIAGELKTTTYVPMQDIARGVIKDIGYTGPIVLEYAIKYLEGKRTEEKVINFVKSFYFFKNKVLKSV